MLRGHREGIAMTGVFHLYFNNIFDTACAFTFVSFVLFIIFALQVCEDKLKFASFCVWVAAVVDVLCSYFCGGCWCGGFDFVVMGCFLWVFPLFC